MIHFFDLSSLCSSKTWIIWNEPLQTCGYSSQNKLAYFQRPITSIYWKHRYHAQYFVPTNVSFFTYGHCYGMYSSWFNICNGGNLLAFLKFVTHWQVVKHIFRYVKGIETHGFLYSSHAINNTIFVWFYDVNWAGKWIVTKILQVIHFYLEVGLSIGVININLL